MKNKHSLITTLLSLALVAPAFADEPPTPVVSVANQQVLIQRGQEFIPATPDMALLPSDRIVLLEGGNVELTCDGNPVAEFRDTGVFPVPACPAMVAGSETPAAAPVTPAPTPAPTPTPTVRKSGSSWGAVAGVTGGVVLLAAAAGGGGGGGGGNPPVSP